MPVCVGCMGAEGDVTKAHAIMKEVPGLVKRKNAQIEAFVLKRVSLACMSVIYKERVKPCQHFCSNL